MSPFILALITRHPQGVDFGITRKEVVVLIKPLRRSMRFSLKAATMKSLNFIPWLLFDLNNFSLFDLINRFASVACTLNPGDGVSDRLRLPFSLRVFPPSPGFVSPYPLGATAIAPVQPANL